MMGSLSGSAVANTATTDASGHLDPGARLQATITNLSGGLTEKLNAIEANANSAWNALAPLAWILGVSLTGLFVSGWTYSWVRARRHPDKQYLFPSVHVEERFGAPFGGGVTASTNNSPKTGDHVSQSAGNDDSLLDETNEPKPNFAAN